MKLSAPLNPIRRAVGESAASFRKLVVSVAKPDRPQNNRMPRFKNLEDRQVLSITGFDADPTLDPAYVASEFGVDDYELQNDVISYLKVLVNGDVHTLTSVDKMLELIEGDHVEVIEIGFQSTETTGIFAAEGYVSKIGDLSSASLVDYNDGRFSGGERDIEANGVDGTIAGLDNAWVVESGWDRMTINLMHYDIATTEVGAHFSVQLQVGRPAPIAVNDTLDANLSLDVMENDIPTHERFV